MSKRRQPSLRRAPALAVGIAALLGLACFACGDDVPAGGPNLVPVDTLLIAAHQDDDLIFMQPELLAVLGRQSTTTVYVTAGNGSGGLDVALRRNLAVRIAYSQALRPTLGWQVAADDWTCHNINLGEQEVERCWLAHNDHPDAHVTSLVFLGYRDGGKRGEAPGSLRALLEQAASVQTISRFPYQANAATLQAQLVDVLHRTSPRTVHLLDFTGAHGYDHSDHLLSASVGLFALAEVGFAGELIVHRGYNVEGTAPTLFGQAAADAAAMLAYYNACVSGCAPCGATCATPNYVHDHWLARQYQHRRVTHATGKLQHQATGKCIASRADATLGLVDCAAASADATLRWSLEPQGALRAGDACLTSNHGALALASCQQIPSQYWVALADRLWQGQPNARPNVDYQAVDCLVVDETKGQPQLATAACGAPRADTWRWLP